MWRARLACALALTGVLGCGEAEPSSRPAIDAGAVTRPEAPSPSPSPPRIAPAPDPAPRERVEAHALDVVSIPEGTLRAGSRPGTPHRRPSVEADLTPVPIPAFDIDRLPYPNDPERPPQLAATRAEAEALCAERGRRLCHELEWERACRGDGQAPFPTGAALDVNACLTDPAACASPTGVLDLGFAAPEWTASDAEPRLSRLERTAVVRGGRPDGDLADHRCGARHVKNPLGGGRQLAFRCCGGDAPTLAYPDVGDRPLFRDLEIDDARWRTIFASIPQLASFAEGFEAFGETEALRALALGGASEADMQWELARGPFAWSPSPGEEVWVVAGRAGAATILAALYPMPDDAFAHAASFVIREEEPVPAAILRTRASRGELLWTTCWSCGGENGVFRFDEDARIVIVQQ